MGIIINPFIEFPPAGFSPADISGLQAWYDFSDISTITKDGSNRVSAVADKSGNDFTLSQATADDQPLWESEEKNGLDAIDFNGDKYMQTGAWTAISQPNTIVGVVLFPVNDGANRKMFNGIGGGTRAQFYKDSVADTFAMYAGATISGVKTGIANTWKEFYTLWNTTASIGEIGGESVISSGNVGSQLLTGLTVSAHHDGSEEYGDNKVGEIIIYNKNVSGTEKTALMEYLTDKWGV